MIYIIKCNFVTKSLNFILIGLQMLFIPWIWDWMRIENWKRFGIAIENLTTTEWGGSTARRRFPSHLASEKRPHKTCSSLRESAANLRMPSDNLSVAIWSSFNSQRNLASSNEIFSSVAFLASAGSNVRTIGSMLLPRSANSFGLMVNRSQPAKAVISPAWYRWKVND